jgi:hypothetical protein
MRIDQTFEFQSPYKRARISDNQDSKHYSLDKIKSEGLNKENVK